MALNERVEKVEDCLSTCGAREISSASTHKGRLNFWNVNGKILLVQDTGQGVEVYVPVTQSNDMTELLKAVRNYAKT
jgi:hypothetical protein